MEAGQNQSIIGQRLLNQGKQKVHITEGTLGKMAKHHPDLTKLVDRAMTLEYVGRDFHMN